MLSKITVNLALEAPPEGKTPSGNADLMRKRRHPGRSSTGPSTHVEPLSAAARRARQEIWYHVKSCGSGLMVDRKATYGRHIFQ